MTASKIPFNQVVPTGNEAAYMQDVITNGHLAGDGKYTRQCNQLLETLLGAPKAMITTNCTHALEMSGILLDLQPGDEVIVPSFTFVSTVNAYVLRGAKPVFIDCRADTLNMDESLLEGLISPRTKAIVPMHYAGVGCEMDVIMPIAQKYHIPVVEDNAHGLLATYKGKKLGTFGCLATQSFHETKNFTCGEGGALIINDPAYIQRAEIIREKGTNRSRFFRGEIDKYTWVDVGSSYLPSELVAAFLCAQLESHEKIQQKRKEIWDYYAKALSAWAEDHQVQLQKVPQYCEQSYHMFYMLMPSAQARADVLAHLKANGIHAVFHYLPLHLSDYGIAAGGNAGDCPVTEDVADRLVRLPFHNALSQSDQDRVISALLAFYQ